MCGRYSFSSTREKILEEIGDLEIPEALEQNYNVAPTQKGYVITNEEPGKLQSFMWGLIPFWSKEDHTRSPLINARREGLEDKPSFRVPFRKQRCLVLADSFYEWEKKGKEKIPYRILLKKDRLMVFAGIWDEWKNEAETIHSFSIITTAPNRELAMLHDRMPALLIGRDQRQAWLEETDTRALHALLEPPPDGILEIYRVSSKVNYVRNNGLELHEPV